MDVVTAILAGFGLSAPAGLNAWLCLFAVGLLARLTPLIHLTPPYDLLSNIWVLIVLGVLLFIELFVDKVPAVDSINDMIHTVIRPVAGGILFAAYVGAVGKLDPTFGFILGILSAGSVHAVKATARPLITATTGGIANPLVSFVEDIIAAVSVVLALIVPIVAALIMASILVAAFIVVRRWRARRKQKRLNLGGP